MKQAQQAQSSRAARAQQQAQAEAERAALAGVSRSTQEQAQAAAAKRKAKKRAVVSNEETAAAAQAQEAAQAQALQRRQQHTAAAVKMQHSAAEAAKQEAAAAAAMQAAQEAAAQRAAWLPLYTRSAADEAAATARAAMDKAEAAQRAARAAIDAAADCGTFTTAAQAWQAEQEATAAQRFAQEVAAIARSEQARARVAAQHKAAQAAEAAAQEAQEAQETAAAVAGTGSAEAATAQAAEAAAEAYEAAQHSGAQRARTAAAIAAEAAAAAYEAAQEAKQAKKRKEAATAAAVAASLSLAARTTATAAAVEQAKRKAQKQAKQAQEVAQAAQQEAAETIKRFLFCALPFDAVAAVAVLRRNTFVTVRFTAKQNSGRRSHVSRKVARAAMLYDHAFRASYNTLKFLYGGSAKRTTSTKQGSDSTAGAGSENILKQLMFDLLEDMKQFRAMLYTDFNGVSVWVRQGTNDYCTITGGAAVGSYKDAIDMMQEAAAAIIALYPTARTAQAQQQAFILPQAAQQAACKAVRAYIYAQKQKQARKENYVSNMAAATDAEQQAAQLSAADTANLIRVTTCYDVSNYEDWNTFETFRAALLPQITPQQRKILHMKLQGLPLSDKRDYSQRVRIDKRTGAEKTVTVRRSVSAKLGISQSAVSQHLRAIQARVCALFPEKIAGFKLQRSSAKKETIRSLYQYHAPQEAAARADRTAEQQQAQNSAARALGQQHAGKAEQGSLYRLQAAGVETLYRAITKRETMEQRTANTFAGVDVHTVSQPQQAAAWQSKTTLWNVRIDQEAKRLIAAAAAGKFEQAAAWYAAIGK